MPTDRCLNNVSRLRQSDTVFCVSHLLTFARLELRAAALHVVQEELRRSESALRAAQELAGSEAGRCEALQVRKDVLHVELFVKESEFLAVLHITRCAEGGGGGG